jgi:hypothetical protein
MTYYIKRGSQFSVTNEADMELHEILPPDSYTVGFDQLRGVFYLETIEQFKPVPKIYGDTNKIASRIFSTYLSRPNSTGVLLCGEKGSGKTLLAKVVSIDGISRGIPTIVISQPWHGEGFNRFVQSIEQEAVIIFDEFEKVYDTKEDQESILTLLDGTYPSKKLFVMTVNDRWAISKFMLNRPGRFFYALEYDGISEEFVIEYCNDNLEDKSKIDSVTRFVRTFTTFNFDMLKALVEEMNRYNEPVIEAVKYLNISANGETARYVVSSLVIDGTTLKPEDISEDVSNGNFISLDERVTITYHSRGLPKTKKKLQKVSPDADELEEIFYDTDDDDATPRWKTVRFAFSDIKFFDGNTVTYVSAKTGDTATIARKKVDKYNAADYL